MSNSSYPHPIRLRGPWECEPLSRYGGGALPSASRAAVPGDWGAQLGADFRGRVRYRRWFHRPTEIAGHERAWLVVEGLDPRGTVALNGLPLGAVAGYALPAEFEVSPLLLPRNELLLEIDFPPEEPGATAVSAVLDVASIPHGSQSRGAPGIVRPGRAGLPGGPLGEVRLEIRGPYYVEDFALTALERGGEVEIAVSGAVRGSSPSVAADDASEPADCPPLELIVTTEHGELLAGEVVPGRPFTLHGATQPFAPWRAGQPCRPMDVEVRLLDGGTRIWQRRLRTAHRPAISTSDALAAEVVERVLDEAAYTQFDEEGRTVAQRLPADWAAAVCPRLAHHPSLVAWAGVTEPSSAAQILAPRVSFDRPWIARPLGKAGRISSVDARNG